MRWWWLLSAAPECFLLVDRPSHQMAWSFGVVEDYSFIFFVRPLREDDTHKSRRVHIWITSNYLNFQTGLIDSARRGFLPLFCFFRDTSSARRIKGELLTNARRPRSKQANRAEYKPSILKFKFSFFRSQFSLNAEVIYHVLLEKSLYREEHEYDSSVVLC